MHFTQVRPRRPLGLAPAGSDRTALKELAPTCADRGHWGIVMCRFLWGIAALEVYLGLYRLARPVGAGPDRAAYPF